jgi:hypothetical protein
MLPAHRPLPDTVGRADEDLPRREGRRNAQFPPTAGGVHQWPGGEWSAGRLCARDSDVQGQSRGSTRASREPGEPGDSALPSPACTQKRAGITLAEAQTVVIAASITSLSARTGARQRRCGRHSKSPTRQRSRASSAASRKRAALYGARYPKKSHRYLLADAAMSQKYQRFCNLSCIVLK